MMMKTELACFPNWSFWLIQCNNAAFCMLTLLQLWCFLKQEKKHLVLPFYLVKLFVHFASALFFG